MYYVSPDYKLMVVTLNTKADGLQPSVPQELFPLPAEVTMWIRIRLRSTDNDSWCVLRTSGSLRDRLP